MWGAPGGEPEQRAGDVRQRTVVWQDPLIGARASRSISGLSVLQAIASGDLPVPPVAALLGMDLVEVSRDRVMFAMEPGEFHYNPVGTVHGGVLTTLLDSAMGCAVQAHLEAGIGYTTIELKVNFIRPVTVETGPLRCVGAVMSLGTRVATAEARLLDHHGRLVGHATSTCLLMRGV